MRKNRSLKIFYDGACGVCSTEMTYYRSLAVNRLHFIDIAAADFNAEDYGRPAEAFQKELHICDEKNNFYTGVEAFRKLWEELPSPFYPLLSTFVGLPVINFSARCGYAVFARFRHFLPTANKAACKLDITGKKH